MMNVNNQILNQPLTYNVVGEKESHFEQTEASLISRQDLLNFLKQSAILDHNFRIADQVLETLPDLITSIQEIPQIIEKLHQLINRPRTAKIVIKDEYDEKKKPITYSMTYSIAGICQAILKNFKDDQVKTIFNGSTAQEILEPLYRTNAQRLLLHFGFEGGLDLKALLSGGDIDLKFYIEGSDAENLEKIDQDLLNFILTSIFPQGVPKDSLEIVEGALRVNFYKFNKIFWNNDSWVGSYKFHDLDISISKSSGSQNYLFEKDRFGIALEPYFTKININKSEMQFSLCQLGTLKQNWQTNIDQYFGFLHTDAKEVNSKCFPRLKSLQGLGFIHPELKIEEELIRKGLLPHETFANLTIDEFFHHGRGSKELCLVSVVNTLDALSRNEQLPEDYLKNVLKTLNPLDEIDLPVFKLFIQHLAELSSKQAINSTLVQEHLALFKLLGFCGVFQTKAFHYNEELGCLQEKEFCFFTGDSIKSCIEIVDKSSNGQALLMFSSTLFKLTQNIPLNFNPSKIKEVLSAAEGASKLVQEISLKLLLLFYAGHPEKIDLYLLGQKIYQAIGFQEDKILKWKDLILQAFHCKGLNLDLSKVVDGSAKQKKLHLGLAYFKTKNAVLKEIIKSHWLQRKDLFTGQYFLFYFREMHGEALAWLKKRSKELSLSAEEKKRIFLDLQSENLSSKAIFEGFLGWCESFFFTDHALDWHSLLLELEGFCKKILVESPQDRFKSSLEKLPSSVQTKIWINLCNEAEILSQPHLVCALLKIGIGLTNKNSTENSLMVGLMKLWQSLDRKKQSEALFQQEWEFINYLSSIFLIFKEKGEEQEWNHVTIQALLLAKETLSQKRGIKKNKIAKADKFRLPELTDKMIQSAIDQILSSISSPKSIKKEDFILFKQLLIESINKKLNIPSFYPKIIVLGWCYDVFQIPNFISDFYPLISCAPQFISINLLEDISRCLPDLNKGYWLVDLDKRMALLDQTLLADEQAFYFYINFLKSTAFQSYPDFLLKIFQKLDNHLEQKLFLTRESACLLLQQLNRFIKSLPKSFGAQELLALFSLFRKLEPLAEKNEWDNARNFLNKIFPLIILKLEIDLIDCIIKLSINYNLLGDKEVLSHLFTLFIDNNMPFSILQNYLGLFEDKIWQDCCETILFKLKREKWDLWCCKCGEFTQPYLEKILVLTTKILLTKIQQAEGSRDLTQLLMIVLNQYQNFNSHNYLKFISPLVFSEYSSLYELYLKGLANLCAQRNLETVEREIANESCRKILKKMEGGRFSAEVHQAFSQEGVLDNLDLFTVEQIKFLSCNQYDQLLFLFDNRQFLQLFNQEIEHLVPLMNHALYLVVEDFSKENNGTREKLLEKALTILYCFVFGHSVFKDVDSHKKMQEFKKCFDGLVSSVSTQEEGSNLSLPPYQALLEKVFPINSDQKLSLLQIFADNLNQQLKTHASLKACPYERNVLGILVLISYRNLLACYPSIGDESLEKLCALFVQSDFIYLEESKNIYLQHLLPILQLTEEKSLHCEESKLKLLRKIKNFLPFFYNITNEINFPSEDLFDTFQYYLETNKNSLKAFTYSLDLLLKLENHTHLQEDERLYDLHKMLNFYGEPFFRTYVSEQNKRFFPVIVYKLRLFLKRPFSKFYIKIQSLHFNHFLKSWDLYSEDKDLDQIITLYEQLMTKNIFVTLSQSSNAALGNDFLQFSTKIFVEDHPYEGGYYPYYMANLKAFLLKIELVLRKSKTIRNLFQKKLLNAINPAKLSPEEQMQYKKDLAGLKLFFKKCGDA